MSTLSGYIEYAFPVGTFSSVRDRGIEYSTSGHRKVRILDQIKLALRSRHYSRRTEQTYCQWGKRFVYFHNLRHPSKMAKPEINAFLTHLAINERVSTSTQNQALSALLFLYRHVLNRGGKGVKSPVDGL